MSNLPTILHGPRLKPVRPKPGPDKTAPTTWQIGCRIAGDVYDGITRTSHRLGVAQADIIRTAVVEFLEKYDTDYVISSATSHRAVSQPVIESPPTASAPLPQPAQHDRWRGNGQSDHPAHIAVRDRQAARKKSGQAGERLVDTPHSRQGGYRTDYTDK